MDQALAQQLIEALNRIDRPGSFCAHGSVPVILPGLEVKKVGPIGLPLTASQAEELKGQCEQAPHGKGTVTRVDTSVRRVWHLAPNRFTLTNPDWDQLLKTIIGQVQEELGLETQKLEAHLYDLLLYEPGCFFLPHKDSEKLDRMVATLVVVLPSTYEGGELVVRHEGREESIDFGSTGQNHFRIQYAAFYADCEHEIRPLLSGHRLCLVYNLTLAKGKKGLKAPRAAEHIEEVAALLRQWAQDPEADKLAITLEHQYTEKGLGWDALKGVDRAVASILAEAARAAGCLAYLALLTLWESGSGYPEHHDYRGRRRRYYDDEDEDEEEGGGGYVMEDVNESTLTATNWKDRDGNGLPLEEMDLEEEDLLYPEALREVEPEEEFEGYTGNAGMTLDRWYRHAAIILWPESRHFAVLCGQSAAGTIPLLKKMVTQFRKASKKDAPTLKTQCRALAATIMKQWPSNPYGSGYGEEAHTDELFGLLRTLDEPKLINTYLTDLMVRDLSLDPGSALTEVCQEQGWPTLAPQLTTIFQKTDAASLPRNIRVLEHLATPRAKNREGWSELLAALAGEVVAALERIDLDKTAPDWRRPPMQRATILPGLVRALVAADQQTLLSRLVAHTLAHPSQYPLLQVHVPALRNLQDWLSKHVKSPSPGLTQ